MEFKIYNSASELALGVAEKTIEIFQQLAHDQKSFSIAISGGETPVEFYKLLSDEPYCHGIPWKNTHIFWCDERCVNFSDHSSNYGQFSNLVIGKIDMPPENIHPIDCSRGPDKAVEWYIQKLARHATGTDGIPVFDIVFLGLGEDGHTASLFPGNITDLEQSNPVISNLVNYQNRPAQRISLTPMVLNKARNIIFIVSGENKATILYEIIRGKKDLEKYPAQRIVADEGNIIWMVDKSAAERFVGKK